MRKPLVYAALAAALSAPAVAQQTAQDAKTGAPSITDADRGTARLYNLKEAIALQVTLDNAGFSPGEIDGKLGKNTLRALEAYEGAHGAKATPAPNGGLREYTIAAGDVAGPFSKVPADMMAKSKLDRLGYASAVERLSERFHVKPELLRQLNTGKRFAAGETIKVPAVDAAAMPESNADARATGTSGTAPANVTVVVSRSRSSLQVMDQGGKVIFRAPVTTGSAKDPLPLGTWQVTAVSRNPTFNYNPDLFWDADPSHAKARIPAGPNNPVGVVWIDLSKEHYGIHGTPEPGRIGYSESHGCIRLTNWDALKLASLVSKGTTVVLVE